MNFYLLPAIESGPKVVARLIQLIPNYRWDIHGDPNRFTVREVVAHLADWERWQPKYRAFRRTLRCLAIGHAVARPIDDGDVRYS